MAVPFFITCSGRSGSTLLAGMLNMHSHIHVPVELGGLYSNFPLRLRHYGDLSIGHNLRLLSNDISHLGHLREFGELFDHTCFRQAVPSGDTTLRLVIESFYDALLEPTGKALLGDKTPDHMPYFDLIVRLFPDARIVHLVRDGRDCALSSMAWRGGINFRNPYELATGWSIHNTRVAEFGRHHPDQYLRVYYEDLVREPSFVLSKVTSFLGYTYDPAMLDYQSSPFARKNADTLGHHDNLTREVLSANYGKWRTDMPQSTLRVYDSIAGETLSTFGYRLESTRDGVQWRLLRLTWRLTTALRRIVRRVRHARVEADFRVAITVKRRCRVIRLRDVMPGKRNPLI